MILHKLTEREYLEVWEALEKQPEFFDHLEDPNSRVYEFRARKMDNMVVALALYVGDKPRTGHFFATSLACNEAGINPEGT